MPRVEVRVWRDFADYGFGLSDWKWFIQLNCPDQIMAEFPQNFLMNWRKKLSTLFPSQILEKILKCFDGANFDPEVIFNKAEFN